MQTTRLTPLFSTLDLATSTAFYCDHLGFEVAADLEGYVELRSRQNAQVTLAFMQPKPGEEARGEGLIYCFQVEDVDAEYARLRHHDLVFDELPEDKPWGDRAMVLMDPGGIRLYLFTPLD